MACIGTSNLSKEGAPLQSGLQFVTWSVPYAALGPPPLLVIPVAHWDGKAEGVTGIALTA